MSYKRILDEVRNDYYKMEFNEYSTLRRLMEELSKWDQPDFDLSGSIDIDDNGDIYIQGIKCFNIKEEYGISSECDAVFISLKEGNVIGNKRLAIILEWNVGVSQIYMDWIDDEYDEKGYMVYERKSH